MESVGLFFQDNTKSKSLIYKIRTKSEPTCKKMGDSQKRYGATNTNLMEN